MWKNKVAVVTGASGGIGSAIVRVLISQGMKVYGISRSGRVPEGCLPVVADLAVWETVWPTLETLTMEPVTCGGEPGLDLLIHAAGMFYNGGDQAMIDRQNSVNASVPEYVTNVLFPHMKAVRGQVVFLNSLSALSVNPRPQVAHYAASKRELRAVADAFRLDANLSDLRVLTVYLGQVATPMQESAYREEGRPYHPASLLQPDDVAQMILHCLNLPRTAEVTEMTLRSMHVE